MRASRLLGSESVRLIFEVVISRSAPATLFAAPVKALRTESSRPYSTKAASTENNVKNVRVLRRKRVAQMSCMYFMRNTPGAQLSSSNRQAPRPRPEFPCRGAEYGVHTRRLADRA